MTNHAKVGGILSIISGVLGVLGGLFFLFISFFIPAFITSTDPGAFQSPQDAQVFNFVAYIYGGIGVFLALISVLAIVGGVYALKKKHWGLALTGAIVGAITFLPTGVPAIIFTAMGKQEFAVSAIPPPAPVPPPPPFMPTPPVAPPPPPAA